MILSLHFSADRVGLSGTSTVGSLSWLIISVFSKCDQSGFESIDFWGRGLGVRDQVVLVLNAGD